jgi:hypothetical protein
MTMKNRIALFAVFSISLLSSCTKVVENVKDRFGSNAPVNQYVEHNIISGSHNSDKNGYRSVNTTEMKFAVKFDNSAVYQTVDPANQGDINKLYGFSDNDQEHHINSARIGWRWYNNQLQLLAYVYNNSVESNNFITTVSLNQDINCSIKAEGNNYVFDVNGTTVTMPRVSTTPQAVGYQLYPYFGGDEVAPQNIRILIKDINIKN